MRWLIAIGLGLAVVIALVMWRDQPVPSETTVDAPLSAPDYWLETATVERFDADGRPVLQLDAQHMAHFPDDDRSELNQVQVRQNGPGDLLWKMTSDHGLIRGERDLIELRGDVRLERRPGVGPVTYLFSDSLDFHPEQDLAVTADPVHMERGTSRTTGRGLRAALGEDRLTIQNDVRTRYAPDS